MYNTRPLCDATVPFGQDLWDPCTLLQEPMQWLAVSSSTRFSISITMFLSPSGHHFHQLFGWREFKSECLAF